MAAAYRWEPIVDLPENFLQLTDGELDPLLEVWMDQRARLQGERELTAGYIKELHAALMRNQDTFTVLDQFERLSERPMEKGVYKSQPNNPRRPDGEMHEYCPPEHVAAEMDRMLALYRSHGAKNVPVEVEAAWLHHVFTQIHPFADGNGRVARSIASLVSLKGGWFPVVVDRDHRTTYIDALETADAGNLRFLVALLARAQRRVLLNVSQIAYEAKPPQTPGEAIAAVRDRLIAEGIAPREWDNAKDVAQSLSNHTFKRLEQVACTLTGEVARVSPGFHFSAEQVTADQNWIAEIADDMGHTSTHNWVACYKLGSEPGNSAGFYVFFMGPGRVFTGLLPVSAYSREGTRKPERAVRDIFLISYREPPEKALERFQPWLEQAITQGLNLWRAHL